MILDSKIAIKMSRKKNGMKLKSIDGNVFPEMVPNLREK